MNPLAAVSSSRGWAVRLVCRKGSRCLLETTQRGYPLRWRCSDRRMGPSFINQALILLRRELPLVPHPRVLEPAGRAFRSVALVTGPTICETDPEGDGAAGAGV